jgi:hypothetical protein
VESAEMRAMRRAAREGAMVIIDLKDAASCLCWSLVRRALRHVVRRPMDPCVPPQRPSTAHCNNHTLTHAVLQISHSLALSTSSRRRAATLWAHLGPGG